MVSDIGKLVSEVILEDWDGAGHWKDAEQLALYLVGSFIPQSLKHVETQPVAEAVIGDLAGAGRFRDVDTLAAFLDEEMGKVAALP